MPPKIICSPNAFAFAVAIPAASVCCGQGDLGARSPSSHEHLSAQKMRGAAKFIKFNDYSDAGPSFILIETFTPFPPFPPF